MKKKLLIIAYAFPPSSAVGAQRPMRMVKYLDRHSDWQASVISVHKNKMRHDETLSEGMPDSTEVYRVGTFEPLDWLERVASRSNSQTPVAPKASAVCLAKPSNEKNDPVISRGIKQHIKDFLSTPDSQYFWNFPVIAKAMSLHRDRPFDAIIVTSPPWSLQFAGFVLSKLLRVPWIADYRDPWTDIDRLSRTPLFEKWNRKMEDSILPGSAAVISTSETYSDILRGRFSQQNPKDFHTLYNGFDEDKITDIEVPASGKFTVVHLGSLYEIWKPFSFFVALAGWLTDHPDRRDHCCLRFVGQLGRSTVAMLDSLGLSDIVDITGYLPHEEAIRACKAADMLLLALGSSSGVPAGWLPSKLFEYLGFQRPILANIGKGEAQRLIERARAGFCVNSGDDEGYRAVLNDLYTRKQASSDGRIPWKNDSLVIQELTQIELVKKLARILDRVSGYSDQEVEN